MIVRGPRAERNFTILANGTLRDGRLSFKARGLLAFVLSQEPDFRVSSEELAESGPDGRDAIRSALRELEAVGYLRRERRRVGDGRIFTEAVVYEVPGMAENPPQPAPDFPSPVRPATLPEMAGRTDGGFSGAGRAGANRRTRHEEELEKDSASAQGNPLSLAGGRADPFERFWAAYPRRVARGAARKAWPRAVQAAGGPDRIIAGAERFAVDPNREDAFTPHPSSWLNAERWDDPPLPVRPGVAPVVPRSWGAIAAARETRKAQP